MCIETVRVGRLMDVHVASAADVAEAEHLQRNALRSTDLNMYALPAAIKGKRCINGGLHSP